VENLTRGKTMVRRDGLSYYPNPTSQNETKIRIGFKVFHLREFTIPYSTLVE
jgi:hypothetical protein